MCPANFHFVSSHCKSFPKHSPRYLSFVPNPCTSSRNCVVPFQGKNHQSQEFENSRQRSIPVGSTRTLVHDDEMIPELSLHRSHELQNRNNRKCFQRNVIQNLSRKFVEYPHFPLTPPYTIHHSDVIEGISKTNSPCQRHSPLRFEFAEKR